MGNKDSELLKSKKAKIVYRRLINASNVKFMIKFFQIINPDDCHGGPKIYQKILLNYYLKKKY